MILRKQAERSLKDTEIGKNSPIRIFWFFQSPLFLNHQLGKQVWHSIKPIQYIIELKNE